MFGKKRIRCKIVNYSDGTILQRATDSNHKKKYFIGNMKYCNKDNTVLEFTVLTFLFFTLYSFLS